MTASIENRLADHGSRIKSLEEGRREDHDNHSAQFERIEHKVDRLIYWILGACGATIMALLAKH